MRGKGVGEVLTLMSNDVDKLVDWFWTFPLGVCSVVQYIGTCKEIFVVCSLIDGSDNYTQDARCYCGISLAGQVYVVHSVSFFW